MKALALVILFSVAANAQYPIQAEKGTRVKQSRLSELSPRAGPDRPRTTSVPLSVLTPLTALGGLGRDVTISQEARPTTHYIQPQVLGLGSRRVGTPVYDLTPPEGADLSQLQEQGVHGYAVEEPSQEDPHEQTSEGYQLVLQRVPSKTQPQETQQFGNPIVEEYYDSSQSQEHHPILFRSPQQNVQQNQELYSSSINLFQPQGELQQVFSQQQQFYEQKPNIQYIQTNPSITTANPLPPSSVHLASINPPRYQTTTEALFPEVNQQNSGEGLYKEVSSYGVASPTSYAQRPQYYSVQLNEQQQEPIENRAEPVTGSYFQSQVHSQTTTPKPLLSVPRVIPVEYQPQISQSRGNVGVPEGIYDANGAIIALRSGGKVEPSQQPIRIVSYIPQQYLDGSSNVETSYNANQGHILRNPVEYASPFARQELLELRQKKNV